MTDVDVYMTMRWWNVMWLTEIFYLFIIELVNWIIKEKTFQKVADYFFFMLWALQSSLVTCKFKDRMSIKQSVKELNQSRMR